MIAASSSAMSFLAGTTITPSNGLRNAYLPLSHVKVSNFMPSNSKSRESELCVASMNVGVQARFGSLSRGGAVLERPSFDQSQFDPSTQVEEGGDIGRLKDKRGTGSGDSYKVLLLDDERHTEKIVSKVLPQAVPSVTPDDARRLFNESQQNGVAVVIVTVKDSGFPDSNYAEYCYGIQGNRPGLHLLFYEATWSYVYPVPVVLFSNSMSRNFKVLHNCYNLEDDLFY